MRQHGFDNVMIGVVVINTLGMNVYYFALIVMPEIFHAILFIIMSMWVIYTLHYREFTSKVDKTVTAGQKYLNLNIKISLHCKVRTEGE